MVHVCQSCALRSHPTASIAFARVQHEKRFPFEKSNEETLIDARQIAYGYNHRPYLTHFVLTVEARSAGSRQ